MLESKNHLIKDTSEFFILEIPKDLKNILAGLSRIRTENKLKERLLKIKNHNYGNELNIMFSGFIGKNLKIEHPEIGENIKQSKSIHIDENGDEEEKDNYVCSGYIVGKMIDIKFYNHALWSLVLQNPDGGNSIVSMSEINDGITIKELTDKEFKKHKRIIKLKDDVSNQVRENINGTYSQY